MKSRVTFATLPKEYQPAAIAFAQEHERRYRLAITERFILAFVLVMSDLGYGRKRLMRTYGMLDEILRGYSDEAYGDDADKVNDIERMNELMLEECKRRKIHIDFDGTTK